jgi:hypothetical protein
VNAAFGTFFGALIGFVLLPWSTLMYLTVYPGGIFGFESPWEERIDPMSSLAQFKGPVLCVCRGHWPWNLRSELI